jgi:hypothetical protein
MPTNANTTAIRRGSAAARAHVKGIVQRTLPKFQVALTEKQMLELAHIVTVALRDKPKYQHSDKGYRLVISDAAVQQCSVKPPCEGASDAAIDLLARPSK